MCHNSITAFITIICVSIFHTNNYDRRNWWYYYIILSSVAHPAGGGDSHGNIKFIAIVRVMNCSPCTRNRDPEYSTTIVLQSTYYFPHGQRRSRTGGMIFFFMSFFFIAQHCQRVNI